MANLTSAQLVTLQSDIDANSGPGGDFENIPLNSDGHLQIANLYNQDASPDYWIFRSAISTDELSNVIDLQDMTDITSADSDRVIKLFQLRNLNGGSFDGRNPRTRSAWDDVFSAAAGDNSQQAIAALWTRLALRGERVFVLSTGTGADSSNADTTAVEDKISASNVEQARELP